jgi:hypothetical protein
MSELLANRISNATLDVIEAAAHSSQHENRDVWLQSIESHLEGLDRA